METGTLVKKCTNYKFCSYKLQSISVDVTVNHCLHFSTVLGAATRCKQYSEITVESETQVKGVKNTLNIFAVRRLLGMVTAKKWDCASQFG